jgi:uroporphyrinogen-III synthase
MRVLVTRPGRDAERTARALAARGHEAVLAPVLRIVRTNMPPPAGAFDAVILTSVNAVPALTSLADAAKTLPIFAVGERTASAVAAPGRLDVRTAGGDAASLAEMIGRTMRRNTKLLLIAGRDRKPEPEAALSAAGFVVATWIAYEASAAERLPDAALNALREGQLAAALHYSHRSAGIVLDLVEDAGVAAEFRALAHICLSADVADALQHAGAPHVAIAARPDENALLTAVDHWARKHGKRARA